MPKRVMVRRRNGHLKTLPPMAMEKREKARKKQLAAMELRTAGATYREIAEGLGYSDPSAAKKAVDAVLKRTELDLAEDIVILDLQRLDEMQKRATAQLRTKNDLSQIDRIMRIMEMRYRLAGVAPETVKRVQESYGLGEVTNNGVMVVQVGHNDEQDFVKRLMMASGVKTDTPEAQAYLERIGSPKQLTDGQEQQAAGSASEEKPESPRRTVVRRKGKKVVVRRSSSEKPQAGGSNKGVSTVPPTYEGSMDTHPVLEESEIVDAEIVDDGNQRLIDVLDAQTIDTMKKIMRPK